jgi:hypothetical protein
VNESVIDRVGCCERHRRWLLAVALLAGGTGIALGSAIAALSAGTDIPPLVWVSLLGRIVTTAGIVFAWSSLEARPLAIRVLRERFGRSTGAHRAPRDGTLNRAERTRSGRARRYARSLGSRLRRRVRRLGRRRGKETSPQPHRVRAVVDRPTGWLSRTERRPRGRLESELESGSRGRSVRSSRSRPRR